MDKTTGCFVAAYVVAFVDLLGTGEKNRQITNAIEQAGGAIAAAAPLLEKQVHQVRQFRGNFTTYAEKTAKPSLLEALTPTLTGNPVKINHFSDSLIIHASLDTRNGCLVPLEPCFKIMFGLTGALLVALARGVPFRGGIEVGPAASFMVDEGREDVLGPALSDAVELEEKKAEWPRIVIGKELLRQVAAHLSPSANSMEAQMNMQLASLIKGLIFEADDGQKTLDVFGSSFQAMQPDQNMYWQLIAWARNFASQEVTRPCEETNKKAAQMKERYQALCRYLEGQRE